MDAIDRRRSNTRVILITFVLLALAGVALFGPVPLKGRLSSATGDLVHAPLFGSVTIGVLWLLQYFRPLQPLGTSFLARVAVIAATLFATGFATEFGQRFVGRSAAIHDAIANGLGILAATLCYFAWHYKQAHPQRRAVSVALLAAAGISIGMASWAPVGMLRDILVARWQFPLIASFESKTALLRWDFLRSKGRLTTDGVTHGSYAMEVTVSATATPGPMLYEVNPDWTNMKTLELDVVLDKAYPRESVQLMVRVIDRFHRNYDTDTFRSYWTLKPGQPQHLCITRDQIIHGPDTRKIDLANIRHIVLTVMEPGVTTTLRVDNVRLTL